MNHDSFMTKSLNRLNKFNKIAFFLAVATGLCMATPAPAGAEDMVFGKGQITIKTDTGNHIFTTEIAATPQQQAQGLMFRESLPQKSGMLFLFEPPQKTGMWMKNTLISLDMIFIDETGVILFIAEHTTPGSENPIGTDKPVAAVLELNAGIAKKYAMKVGDQVSYEKNHE